MRSTAEGVFMTGKQPNILLITSDQQHWSALGALNPRISTPALDRLAREGTRFDRAYCPSPVCSPSRSSIITGMYPSTHGCWTIGVKLAEDVPTVGERFQEHGYHTSLIGKAHFQPLASTPEQTSLECQPILRDLEFWRGFSGPWYGFEHVEVARMHADEAHAGQHYGLWMEEKGFTNWRDYFQTDPPARGTPTREHAWDLPEEYHYSTWTAERTIAGIERAVAEGTPFLSWASFHDPHPPYLVPEPWASMYDPADMESGILVPGELDAMPCHHRLTQEETPDFSAWRETRFSNHGFRSHRVKEAQLRKDMAIYYGMTSFMDQQIGRILDSLDRLGIADNTIVVFTTDHGHFLGQHGLFHKGAFHYEDLIRLPFLVRAPGQVPEGTESEAIQSLVDLAPTFLEVAGIPVPGIMQGVSQWDVWRGQAESAREWALVENRHQPARLNLRTLVTDRYKVTVYRGSDYGELFDLHEDPGETCNRWADPVYAEPKSAMLLRFLQAEMEREPTRFARIAGA
ncbi:MAG TPA: sulfatase-like hydrolase/transferase [Thermomicrobiales bacterium]|nr:sulfatase-like hydrolase/transferase [Thermomicrobiales bacterium]